MYNPLFTMACHILAITFVLHVLSDLPVNGPSSSLVDVHYSSWYDAHFLFHSETDL